MTECEDELQALRGEISAKQGQKGWCTLVSVDTLHYCLSIPLPDSIEIQQLQADYEAKIESLNTAMNVCTNYWTQLCYRKFVVLGSTFATTI